MFMRVFLCPWQLCAGAYRSKKKGFAFWIVEIVIPLLVLTFGIFCSGCTLGTIDWAGSFSSSSTADVAPPEVASSAVTGH